LEKRGLLSETLFLNLAPPSNVPNGSQQSEITYSISNPGYDILPKYLKKLGRRLTKTIQFQFLILSGRWQYRQN